MKRILSLASAICTLGVLALTPSLAQDKMHGDKMHGMKMGGKMGGGHMHGSEMMKATEGLSDAQKQFITARLAQMPPSDRMAMQKKLAGYSVPVRKGQVTKMMNKEAKMGGKMEGGKMEGGKMHHIEDHKMGGKMHGGKM